MNKIPKELENILINLTNYCNNLELNNSPESFDNLINRLRQNKSFDTSKTNEENLDILILNSENKTLLEKENTELAYKIKLLENNLESLEHKYKQSIIDENELDKFYKLSHHYEHLKNIEEKYNNLFTENKVLKNKNEELADENEELADENKELTFFKDNKELIEKAIEGYKKENEDLKKKQVNYLNLKEKGTELENNIIDGLSKLNSTSNYFIIENVSAINNSADIKLKQNNGDDLLVLIDSKNYTKSVNKSEIEKLKKDLIIQSAQIGILVSTSGIDSKNNYSIEIYSVENKLYYILYLTNYNNNHSALFDLIKNCIFNYKNIKNDKLDNKCNDLLKGMKDINTIYESSTKTIKTIVNKFIDNNSSTDKDLINQAKITKKESINKNEEIEKIEVLDKIKNLNNIKNCKLNSHTKYLVIYDNDYELFPESKIEKGLKDLNDKELKIYIVKK